MDHRRVHHHFRRTHLTAVYALMLLLSLHYALIVYINSSYLSIFFPDKTVSLLYVLGSLITIWIFIRGPWLLRRLGNYRLVLWTIVLAAVSIFGMFTAEYPPLIGAAFVLYHALIALIFFNLDIFLENYGKNEKKTGLRRGLFLTISNVAFVLAPFATGQIIGRSGYESIYFISLILLIPLFFITYKSFRKFKDRKYKDVDFYQTASSYLHHKDMYRIWIVNFALQFFYAAMTIYMPIYLHLIMGFSWEKIGIIFSIMLLPFTLFELPAGELADKKWGEKELLVIGVLIAGASTIFLSLIGTVSLLVWGAALFATRIGASLIEISSETFFFKHTKGSDADLISFFRNTRPLAFIAAPLVCSAILSVVSYPLLFAFLGVFVLFSVIPSLLITDTK